MISHLLNSLLIGVLFADMLERRFPQQVREFLTNITFNALYLYSKMQIYFAKMNKTFNNFIEANPTLLKIKNELDSIIKLKKTVVTCSEFFKNGDCLHLEDAPKFDLAIYSWLGDDNKCVNRKTIYTATEPTTMTEQSDIKFMLVEIKIGENKPYKIDLKTDKYNFYLVGNKFKKQFFLYYLKQLLRIYEPFNENDKIILKIIDHNVNMIEVVFTDKNESVILEKNGYKISVTE
jgi:hypothetical protein